MLKARQDLVRLRRDCLDAARRQQKKLLVCTGTGCVSSGAMEIYERLCRLMAERDLPFSIDMMAHEDGGVRLTKSGCPGLCELGPLIRVEPQGWLYTRVRPDDCEEIVERTVVAGKVIERLCYRRDEEIYAKKDDIPFYGKQRRVVLGHCGEIDSDSIYEYIAAGGYEAFEKALFELDGEWIVKEISDSNLRGRGGGGFPTGRKWTQVRRQPAEPKYIVCNGDEGDPGAFMDRSVMEDDPHRMLEGMMIAGVACRAAEGYVYVRAEYPVAVKKLKNAIRQAEALGLLGDDILGSGFSFHLHINRGAGAFVCGEGSALTASIEGKRGMPRVKPPRTVEQGLFGKPTVLNNVETFANVPEIILKGASWFKSIGPEKSPGTKAFALTGNIVNSGLIEVPMGTKLREVIYDIGGGIRDGRSFKAVQIGGPSGGCLTTEHLDLPLDFDSLVKAGAIIGSGGLVVMDDKTCMVEVARFFMHFTQKESCGKCVPCREGTKRMLEILERIVAGQGREGDIDLLLELADTVTATALCGLGKTAAGPVVSTIRYFRDEYEAHISEKRCPAGSCRKLVKIEIDPEKCRGCSKCAKACPVRAITGTLKKPYVIDQGKCVKCGACVAQCPFNAVRER